MSFRGTFKTRALKKKLFFFNCSPASHSKTERDRIPKLHMEKKDSKQKSSTENRFAVASGEGAEGGIERKVEISRYKLLYMGFPYIIWLSGKEPTCHCRGPRFDPWVKKIPWRREWLPVPGFLVGKFHGQRNLVGYSPRVSPKNWTRFRD